MSQIIIRSLISTLIVACGVGAMLALGSRQQETLPPQDEQKAPQVETVRVQPHAGDLDIEIDGIVSPYREIQVAAEVSGRVRFKDKDCQAGSFIEEGRLRVMVDEEGGLRFEVEQGKLLLEIDPRDYQLEEQRSLRQLQQAQTELEEVDVEVRNIDGLIELAVEDLQLAQNEKDRLTRLSTSISRSELDQAQRAVLAAVNAKQTLENQLSLARVRRSRLLVAQELTKSQIEKAQLDLSRTRIVSPVDGVIVSDLVEEGDYVQKGAPLLVIEDTSSIEVLCNLKMEDLFWLWSQRTPAATAPDSRQWAYQVPRTPATIYYQFAGRDDLKFAWQGTLVRFDGIGLDERTRTVPCRVEVDKPRDVTAVGTKDVGANPRVPGPPALVRGMYVTVVLHVRQGDDFVKVPDEAIQPGKKVWRVRDGRLEQLGPLTLIRGVEETDPQGRAKRFWLAPSGPSRLQSGDRLVITPLPGAYDGMLVDPRDAA